MSNELNTNSLETVEESSTEVVAVTPKKAEKTVKNSPVKKFFKTLGKKIAKLCKDTAGEMKKVVWTPKNELKKNTKLVIVTVVAISIVIILIDTTCSYLINSIAGLLG